MSNSKSSPPPVKVAPEFSGLGRLASILKPAASSPADRIEPALTTDDGAWTVFGVGAIWQAAAENAARLSGRDLGEWVTSLIEEAATAQGLYDPVRED